MDKLLEYLQTNTYYCESDLIFLLSNNKTMITEKHIANMKYTHFNIIKLFETYGYVFTNDEYLMLVKKSGYFLQWIPEDKITMHMLAISLTNSLYSSSWSKTFSNIKNV